MNQAELLSAPHAHSRIREDGSVVWEDLFSGCSSSSCDGLSIACQSCGHLDRVSRLTASFAASMFPENTGESTTAGDWGRVTGLWHDLGKFAPEWQQYLRGKVDPHADEVTGKIDHSTAGAQHSVRSHATLGHISAYPIAGHHSGLLDGESNSACQATRLGKVDIPDYSTSVPEEVASAKLPGLPPFLAKSRDAFSVAFFMRMLFSCLVDADFLATEAFMNNRQGQSRNQSPEEILKSISGLIDARIDSFGVPDPHDAVNSSRRSVVEDCRLAAKENPGIFTLTVPTGGGKTLSSLSFALRHALAHGQRRIIYVVPFNSIIEQNADVIREILATLQTDFFTPLVEHHSSLSPERETTQSRLAAENWDAPIVITTAVQFYESLFAAKTSRCRKLHNIANSVVILDEAQSLPVDLLSPCLRVLQELSGNYRTSVVLCTATQPAVHHDENEFPIGLKGAREIIRDPSSLFDALHRVTVENLGVRTDEALVGRLESHHQVLCIVNRRKHARRLFTIIGEGEGNYHLSALMCPEHRSLILKEVRARLDQGLPTRLISTQLIEAGVDIDFPIVYRALAGLDSIAQAAGRCNRNGKLPAPGLTFVFQPEDHSGETYFRETAQVTRQLLGMHDDILGQEAIRHFFDLYYYQQKPRWDSKDILGAFLLDQRNRSLPFNFSYASVADKFRLIEVWQVSVIIPYDDKARKLIAQLRNPAIPIHRTLLRGLQRYTIQIAPRMRDDNARSFESLRDGQFHALISADLNYSDHFGLTFDEEHASSNPLII